MSKTNYYTQASFGDEAQMSHRFYTRRGGVSRGLYSDLNVGFGSDDEAHDVEQNRARIAAQMGVEPTHLMSVYQEHGARCLTLSAPHDVRNAPKADAMVTNVPGLALGVLTADCTPVLFYAATQRGSVIGAAHAGWKGALGGVLGSTVEAMEKLGAAREDIQAAIGPCIGKNSYEVSSEFAEAFIAEDEGNERFFAAGKRAGHPLFDMAGYCAGKLAAAGLRQVFIQDRDTYALEDEFFSYRRTTHRGEADYGRQMSVIALG